MVSPLVAFILEQDESELVAEIERLNSERARLEAEMNLVQQALAVQRAAHGRDLDEDLQDGVSTRDAILHVMRAAPGRVWEPAEVVEELHRLGLDRRASAVRMMLQRMHGSGDLARPSQGQYYLPDVMNP